MRIFLKESDFDFPRDILDEVLLMCNKVLASPDHLVDVFLGLAKEFCDDAEMAANILPNQLGDSLLQEERIITLCRDDAADDYTMITIPADDIIYVNVLDLPDIRFPDRTSKYLIFLLVSLLHECTHLFTKSLNILAKNSNCTEEKVNDTPEKIGRATINNETETDAGVGLEMRVFGGIMFFAEGSLTVTAVDPNQTISATQLYEVHKDLADSIAEELRSWLLTGDPSSSIFQILAKLHYSKLSLYTTPLRAKMLDRIKSKFHGHIIKNPQDEEADGERVLQELFRKKLQPSNIRGVKK